MFTSQSDRLVYWDIRGELKETTAQEITLRGDYSNVELMRASEDDSW